MQEGLGGNQEREACDQDTGIGGLAPLAEPDAAEEEDQVEQDDEHPTQEAVLFHDEGVDEIGEGHRQGVALGALARSLAEDAAFGDGDLGVLALAVLVLELLLLLAGEALKVLLLFLEVGGQTSFHRAEAVEYLAHARFEPLRPTGKEGMVGEEHQQQGRHQDAHRDAQVLEAHVHEEEHQEADQADQQGGGETVLHDEQADCAHRQQNLQGELLEVVEGVAPKLECARQVEDHADLGELEHLERMSVDLDAADGAVDFRAETRDEKHQEHQHRRAVDDEGEGAVETQRDEVADQQGEETHQHRLGLLHEDGDLADAARRSQEAARREDGGNRDHREEHHDDPDDPVAFEFPELVHATASLPLP